MTAHHHKPKRSATHLLKLWLAIVAAAGTTAGALQTINITFSTPEPSTEQRLAALEKKVDRLEFLVHHPDSK